MPLLEQLKGKAYWRSLDELAETDEYKEFLRREFPQGAPELNNPVTRRTFLRLMGASAALAGMAGCRRPVEKIVPYVKAPEEIIPGIPQYYATTMPLGTTAYGLVVESHEGRPTKIEGNELHPSSTGAAGSFQQAEILNLYDPDRSKFPTQGGVRREWYEFVGWWQQQYDATMASRGNGFAVLAPQYASPTLARLQREFSRLLPEARWVTYDPISDENIYEGLQIAAGAAYQPVYRLENAEVILSLDADFLLLENEYLRNARGFAAGRRVESENDTMNRLYTVESNYTITGAMADHRLPVQSRLIGAFVIALIHELGQHGVSLPVAGQLPAVTPGQFDAQWLRALALDLIRARSRSLVVAGRRQPPAVHALVHAINAALDNINRSIEYFPLVDRSISSRRDFASLVEAMQAGSVSTLVILGGNPVHTAPADLNFAAALQKVGTTIHVGHSPDETATHCGWHLPQSHFLESWGDARAADGTMSVVQPLIAPLFESRSTIEVVSLLLQGQSTSGYELVRETWNAAAAIASGEQNWRRILHDGVLANSRLNPVTPSANTSAITQHLRDNPLVSDAASADNLEIGFYPSATLFDGRYANNGWLQELPDPITKSTWDNPALVSMKFAKEARLQNGDMVELTFDGRALQVPVWIIPGIADYTIALELGYGRTAAGRIGNGVGFNTYSLRTTHLPDFGVGGKVTKLGRTYTIANVQNHNSMEGRAIVRQADIDEYRQNPTFAPDMVTLPHLESMRVNGGHQSLWQEHTYDTGYQWGMTIDLNTCIGCNACTVACQSENNIPIVGKEQVDKGREMHWLRLDRYFEGDDLDNPEMVYQPVACQHCEMAPCESVCPVNATSHDSEGLNVMTYNRCIGTRYCSNNCPFKVRRFNYFNLTKDTPELVKMAMNPNVTMRFRGVMEKCTYCVQRINEGKFKVKQEGRELRDGDVVSACQQTCPVDAIVFGDINNPESRVSKIKEQNRNYEILSELNLRTRTTFLAKIRNPNPEIKKAASAA